MISKAYESFYNTVSSLEKTIKDTERSLSDLSDYSQRIIEEKQSNNIDYTIQNGIKVSSTSSPPNLDKEFSRVSQRFFSQLQGHIGSLFLDNEKTIRGALTKTLGQFTRGFTQNILGNFIGLGKSSLPVQFFANGGVINRPTFFTQSGTLGVAGERGPEAILPLSRGADGQLGVKSAPSHAQTPPVNVRVVNVYDSRQMTEALASSEGERVIINTIGANADVLKRMLRI